MQSAEEYFKELGQLFREGERDGSIHSNPPGPEYLADLEVDEEAEECRTPAPTPATESRMDDQRKKKEQEHDQPEEQNIEI